MENIQRIPAGLINLLGIVGTGQGQQQLSDTLFPMIDAEPYYQARFLEVVNNAVGALSVPGDGAQVDVPADEFWYVGWLAGTISSGLANQRCSLAIGFQIPAGGILQVVAATEQDHVVTTASDQVRIGARVGIVLPPSSRLRAQLLSSVTAGTVSVQINATIQRLRG